MAIHEQTEARALEPIATCLMRQLIVPDVYFAHIEASGIIAADVVLIDRAGVGDVHAVQARAGFDAAWSVLPSVMLWPSHFRWLAVVCLSNSDRRKLGSLSLRKLQQLLPPSGAGRVGLIEVAMEPGGGLGAKILHRAERFHGHFRDSLLHSLGGRSPDVTYREDASPR